MSSTTVKVLLVADPPIEFSRTLERTGGGNTEFDVALDRGTTTFHDLLVDARRVSGDNTLYFAGKVDALAEPLMNKTNWETGDEYVGYRPHSASVVQTIEDITTLVAVRSEHGTGMIHLHPLSHVCPTACFVGNLLVYNDGNSKGIPP
jgi:hypothetical protein